MPETTEEESNSFGTVNTIINSSKSKSDRSFHSDNIKRKPASTKTKKGIAKVSQTRRRKDNSSTKAIEILDGTKSKANSNMD